MKKRKTPVIYIYIYNMFVYNRRKISIHLKKRERKRECDGGDLSFFQRMKETELMIHNTNPNIEYFIRRIWVYW